MINIFKRKTQEERIAEEREKILNNYVKECKSLGLSDDVILQKLITINVPEEDLKKSFNEDIIKEAIDYQIKQKEVINMPKETQEEDYEELADEETEDEEEDKEEPEEEKPKKKVVEQKKEIKKEVSLADILQNIDARLTAVESSLFRLKTI